MPKVYIKTYGCQMNERDSEQVARMFEEGGYERVSDPAEADVVLLNTCSVRDMAEQKALGKMGHLGKLRQANPGMVFGFLGCMAQSRGGELIEALPHVDLVAGTQKFHRVVEHVGELLARKREARMDDPRFSIVDVGAEEGSQDAIRDHLAGARRATAFVSVMQGCNMRCSFCIVPDTRGPERARPIGAIVDEVRGLAGRGVREETLLGQIVNLYGRHEFPTVDGKSPFVQLLEAVHAVDGIERIRFTSPHPVGYREDLVEALGRLPKLAPHVHLPLQSGSDSVLKRMRRGYTAERFEALVGRIRSARPGVAVTTDVIVGFPGETDAEYGETREFFRRIGFDGAFIFKYSPRRDTPAAGMAGQVPEALKEERNRDLLAVNDEVVRRKADALIGSAQEVLCEGVSRTNAARLSGRTGSNRIVVFEGDESRIGAMVTARIVSHTGYTLYGELADA